MMFLSYVALAIPALTLAAAQQTCWSGMIHSSCNGAQKGCTDDGIMVSCQGEQMVFADMCDSTGNGTGDFTCHYESECIATC